VFFYLVRNLLFLTHVEFGRTWVKDGKQA
jgi:hypothetical protein